MECSAKNCDRPKGAPPWYQTQQNDHVQRHVLPSPFISTYWQRHTIDSATREPRHGKQYPMFFHPALEHDSLAIVPQWLSIRLMRRKRKKNLRQDEPTSHKYPTLSKNRLHKDLFRTNSILNYLKTISVSHFPKLFCRYHTSSALRGKLWVATVRKQYQYTIAQIPLHH